jgi:UDPglucose--hexose-1-phosphate uridylyltransferase
MARKQFAGDRDKATTSEMRFDWLADRWVIIAPQRTARPDDFIRQPVRLQDAATCPFCSGKEDETPTAVATYAGAKSSSASHWRVRVVPNKFPAVNTPLEGIGVPHFEAAVDSEHEPGDRIDLFRRRELFGAHEVIIESPEHVQSITGLDAEAIDLVFQAYRDRLDYWLHQRRCAYAVLFKNVGQDAGASLAHTHSQLIATDEVPSDIKRSVDRMQLFFQRESECLFCRMAQDELDFELRVVEQTRDFVAFCPFASRCPSSVTVIPKRHESHFELLDPFATRQLSWLVHRLIRRIEKCYPETAYNFVLHTAPNCLSNPEFFHWRLELFPRLTKVAGFEWGSDCYINPLAPEEAAHNLRIAGV